MASKTRTTRHADSLNVSPRGSPKRVLLTTACETRPYDYINTNIAPDNAPRFKYERHMSYGLRFLQANVPGIEILEYPTWADYLRVIKLGWDAVGFSFYTNEFPVIRRMVRTARKHGIPELWGGNYGILTPEAASLFDRVAVGYSEDQIASWLDASIGELVHPPLIVQLKLGDGLGLIPFGILFAVRGCNRGCTFCQTPSFCGHRLSPVPMASLARVIEEYKRLRVGAIWILDECFGCAPEHSEQVVSLLDESSLPWFPMTRVDILAKRLPDWGPQGLAGALLGIESFQDSHLRRIRKGGNNELIRAVVRRLHAKDRLAIGYYMIGFEDDTLESLQTEMAQLAQLRLDVVQVCILTPFHQTKMWETLSEYGIDDTDLSKFDGKHLVWNHPNITAGEMRAVLQGFFAKAFPPGRDAETMRRFGRQLIRRVGFGAGLSFLIGSFMRANATEA